MSVHTVQVACVKETLGTLSPLLLSPANYTSIFAFTFDRPVLWLCTHWRTILFTGRPIHLPSLIYHRLMPHLHMNRPHQFTGFKHEVASFCREIKLTNTSISNVTEGVTIYTECLLFTGMFLLVKRSVI